MSLGDQKKLSEGVALETMHARRVACKSDKRFPDKNSFCPATPDKFGGFA